MVYNGITELTSKNGLESMVTFMTHLTLLTSLKMLLKVQFTTLDFKLKTFLAGVNTAKL